MCGRGSEGASHERRHLDKELFCCYCMWTVHLHTCKKMDSRQHYPSVYRGDYCQPLAGPLLHCSLCLCEFITVLSGAAWLCMNSCFLLDSPARAASALAAGSLPSLPQVQKTGKM